jgi:molecular chaperone DnaK (HSP70)
MKEYSTNYKRIGNVIGIDLGTTTTLVARFNEAGKPEITTNSEGSRITPSVVQIEDNGNVIFGTEAKKFLGTGTPNVFAEFKRVIGEPGKSWHVGGKEITPEDLCALLLKKVVQDYAAQFGQPDSVVISWPANFRNEQREATKAAVAKAGLKVEYFIEEPVAAALYFSLQHSLDGKYLIYDFGGVSFNVTLLEAHGREIKVLWHEGVQQLGGKDLDEALNKLIGEKFRTKTGDAFDAVDCNFTKLDTESAKHALSTRGKTAVRLVSAKHGPVAIVVTREEFESAISSLVSQAEMACENVLMCGHADSSRHVKKSEIKDVLMIGGTLCVPAMQRSMNRFLGKSPWIFSSEAVALGTATYAAMKTPESLLNAEQKKALSNHGKVVRYFAPHFLGVTYRDPFMSSDRNETLIPKGEKIPCEAKLVVTSDSQGSLPNFSITQSGIEEQNPEYVTSIWTGSCDGFLPESEVEITIGYDENGVVNCCLRELKSSKTIQLRLNQQYQ